jgi:hypothetical protein
MPNVLLSSLRKVHTSDCKNSRSGGCPARVALFATEPALSAAEEARILTSYPPQTVWERKRLLQILARFFVVKIIEAQPEQFPGKFFWQRWKRR